MNWETRPSPEVCGPYEMGPAVKSIHMYLKKQDCQSLGSLNPKASNLSTCTWKNRIVKV